MQNEPLVTIVTPSYNQAQYIEQTILSVLNQTYKNIQYIIVDGGSSDNTMQVIDKYQDSIDIVIHEDDTGQSDAINKGFKLAKGELAGWINSDDILYPSCVERIVSLYNRRKEDGVIFSFSQIDLINSDGGLMYTVEKKFIDKNALIHKDCEVIQQGSFYPVQHIKAIRYLNEELHYCMDLDLWLRLLDLGKIYTVDDAPGAGFRIWAGSKTSTSVKEFSHEIINVLIQNSAGKFSKQIIKNRWYIFKNEIKNCLNGIQVMGKENKKSFPLNDNRT